MGIIQRFKIWQLKRKNTGGLICEDGPCDMQQPICCYNCVIRDKCPDACDRDRYNGCR
jgi:hypothetical protein